MGIGHFDWWIALTISSTAALSPAITTLLVGK
jgi:hypothetical protein